jgi:MFS family permease
MVRYRWLMNLMLSVMVGTMASIMSSTIVNVAIPDMSHHFALGQERAQWVSSGFMVAMTVSMLTTPWLLGRYGYRRTYVGTMLLLMAGGIVGGLANQFRWCWRRAWPKGWRPAWCSRFPPSSCCAPSSRTSRAAPAACSAWAWCWRPALGPSIGGVLVDLFGWRSIFFMVVPFCLASLWLAYRYVPTTAPGGVDANRGTAMPRLARPAAGRGRHAVPAQRPGGTARRHRRRQACCWCGARSRWRLSCGLAAPPGRAPAASR